MRFYVALAWRNLLRNKRRTVIASIAIGISLASLIFYDGWVLGVEDAAVRSATDSFVGQAQIHAKGFHSSPDAALTVRQLQATTASLETDALVEAYSPRILATAMITSPTGVNSVMLVGIDPHRERHLSRVDDAIRQGAFFTGDDPRDMVIGSELAKMLETGLGDRVVATVSSVTGGDLSQEMFRISGIFRSAIKETDQGLAFIRLPVSQRLLGLGDEVHEIAIRFRHLESASDRGLPFWRTYSGNGNEAISWEDLFPQLKRIFDMTGTYKAVLALLLAFVVIFGIINTLFMSLYERLFEFGVLRAVGTRPWGVFKLMLAESGSLGAISALVGILISLVFLGIMTQVGLDYRGIEFAGSTFNELLYPILTLHQFAIYPLGLFVFTLLVGLYPAAVASRMPIADAIRRSL